MVSRHQYPKNWRAAQTGCEMCSHCAISEEIRTELREFLLSYEFDEGNQYDEIPIGVRRLVTQGDEPSPDQWKAAGRRLKWLLDHAAT